MRRPPSARSRIYNASRTQVSEEVEEELEATIKEVTEERDRYVRTT